jgi:hypothetical protein
LEEIDRLVFLRGYVGEPMPWGHTDLLRYIVDTIDGTTAIAAYAELASEIDK